MPKIQLQEFMNLIGTRFPNLKRYDETRLFAVLLQSGVNVEFEFDADGNTMVSYDDIGSDIEKKLEQQ